MPDQTTPADPTLGPQEALTGTGGADGDNSGGGNASGTPDADTGMRAEDVIDKGNVEDDRAKLFPDGGPAA